MEPLEPLEPLRTAVLSEIRRLGTECGPVRVDPERGAVVIDGVTAEWAPAAALASALRRARLDVAVYAAHPGYRFWVYAQR
jgi:hypothetical protein